MSNLDAISNNFKLAKFSVPSPPPEDLFFPFSLIKAPASFLNCYYPFLSYNSTFLLDIYH